MVLVVKNCLPMQEKRRHGFDPWVGKIPWRRAWQPTAVFLPGESHRQRSLAGYSPWGHKELDMTEHAQHQSERTSERECLRERGWQEAACRDRIQDSGQ